MKHKFKNAFVAVFSIAAIFGIVCAAIIVFYPEKLATLKEEMSASAAQEYKLPAPTTKEIIGNDTTFLKSFSKVFATIARESRPALLLIVAEKKVNLQQPDFPDDFFFPFLPPQFGGPRNRQRQQGIETDAGSGFIVDLKNGYAITNNHVIDGATKIIATTFDNHKYKTKLIGTAKNPDIAVLKLENFNASKELKQLSLANSDNVEVGDWAVALGAPFELPQTLTMGVVSAVKRSSGLLGIDGPNSFIQTDAPINPGNSGGPLLNIEGQVIGMNTAIYSKNGTSVGIGFAIPSNTVRLVADSIIKKGKLTQVYIGIDMYDLSKFKPSALEEMKIDPNTEGGLVARVHPGSPAAKAGLQPYDIIQSINGNAVHSPSDIQGQIVFLNAGSSIKIGILRDGKPMVLHGSVTEKPSIEGSEDNRTTNKENIEQDNSSTSNLGLKLSLKKSSDGVLIERVYPNSAAAEAGLQPGDMILTVNNKKVLSANEIEKILNQLKKKDKEGSVAFFLVRKKDGSNAAIILQQPG